MRNTSSITNSVSVDTFNSYNGTRITPSINSGHSSTVIGKKPTAIVCYNFKEQTNLNYSTLGQCVKKCIDLNPHLLKTKLAILCDWEISVSKLEPYLTDFIPNLSCYDAGIEKFDMYYSPVYRNHFGPSVVKNISTWIKMLFTTDKKEEESGVLDWLRQDPAEGTLLTFGNAFRGAEAESVIVISSCWADERMRNPRSSVTRGVANMSLIVADQNMKNTSGLRLEEMEKHFNVIIFDDH